VAVIRRGHPKSATKQAGVVQTDPSRRNTSVKVIRKGRKPVSKLSIDNSDRRTGNLKQLQPPPDVNQTINFINTVPDEQIPYVLATVINHRDMTKNYQESIRMELLKFLTDNFPAFCDDYSKLENEPALRMRLFVEVSKLVMARPKMTDDADVVDDSREAMIRRMFGLSR
jgi:hypothetical protein